MAFEIAEVGAKLNEWKESSKLYRQKPGKLCHKYILLIPESCNTEIPLDRLYTDCDLNIEYVDMLTISVVYGDKKRVYNPTIYMASKRGSSEVWDEKQCNNIMYHMKFQTHTKYFVIIQIF